MTKRIIAVAIILVGVCLFIVLTTGLTAQPIQQLKAVPTVSELGNKDLPSIQTNSPLAAMAQGGLMWFTDQVEFETFNAAEGNFLKGIESFEESNLPRFNSDVFDDPLESFVPNLPDASPFPLGMTGLPNLIIQSNLGGGNPSVENPQGFEGLVAFSDGGSGAVSDIAVARTQTSLDLIFSDAKSGVGFNTVAIGQGGATSVQVRVYGPTNVFLGIITTPADPSGINFIGVWSPDPIGRINIFNPDNRQEGADNIQAWQVPCPWDFDGGGSVSVPDLLSLFESWGPCNGCAADFNGDGSVNTNDLLILFANWGPCP